MKRLVFLLHLSILAGCAHVEPSETIDKTVPNHWRNSSARGQHAEEGQAWEAFLRIKGISKLLEDAYASNPDLQAAQAVLSSAREKAIIARSSLFPWASVNNKFTRDIAADKSAVSGLSKRKDQQMLSPGIRWDIDLWGKTAAEGRASDHDSVAAMKEIEDARRLIATEIIRNTLLIASIQDQRRLGKRAIALGEELNRLVAVRVKLGSSNSLDMLRQQAEVSNLQASVASLDVAEAQALAALAILTGHAPTDVRAPIATLKSIKAPQIDPSTPLDVVNRRPDVRGALETAMAASNRTQAAAAARLPSITLSGALTSLTNGSLAGILDQASFAKSAASEITAPIFQGFRLQAAHDAAIQDQIAAESIYRSKVLNALKETEIALSRMKTASLRISYLSSASSNANSAVGISKKLFEDKVADYSTLLDLQRVSFQAEYDLISERYNLLSAAVDLASSIGGPPLVSADPIDTLPSLTKKNGQE